MINYEHKYSDAEIASAMHTLENNKDFAIIIYSLMYYDTGNAIASEMSTENDKLKMFLASKLDIFKNLNRR